MKKERENLSENQMIRVLSNKKDKPKKNFRWLFEVFFISLGLSILFALVSELMLAHSSLGLALILIILLMVANVFFDLIAMAVTACSIKPLLELSQKNQKGADVAIRMVKNADKVSCICGDVVGDICGILCGAGGVTIAAILLTCCPSANSLIISLLLNAVIASLTITAKAIGKSYALNHSTQIVIFVARKLSFLSKKGKNKG